MQSELLFFDSGKTVSVLLEYTGRIYIFFVLQALILLFGRLRPTFAHSFDGNVAPETPARMFEIAVPIRESSKRAR